MSKEKHGTRKDKKSKSKKHEKSKSNKDEKSKSNKDEKSKLKEKREFGKGKVESFDQLVKENKASGKDWYRGLEGKWWWGMTEENVRARLVEVEQILGKIKGPSINKEDKSEISTISDSQMAPDLGQELENKAPELTKSILKSADKEKVVDKPEANAITNKEGEQEVSAIANKDDKPEVN